MVSEADLTSFLRWMPTTPRCRTHRAAPKPTTTELWFEKACDLWVAIGSDDFSKVWIEDQLVWSSGKSLKAWKLNEGLRKVHFKAGINRVLYRVENGNDKTEFSLVVSLQP